MKMKTTTMLLAVLLCAVPAFATTIFQPGITYQTTALTGFQTFGDMMAGMTVSVTDIAGSTSTANWTATGAGSGGAVGTGWSLVESGDTFSSLWSLNSNFLVSRLFIDAGTGDAVFDTQAIGDVTGTPGSARGMHITDDANRVIYSNYITLTGFPPVGDLFRTLEINFANPTSAYNFITDTDSLKISGDITPSVPEPSTIILLGAGLAGLALARRRSGK